MGVLTNAAVIYSRSATSTVVPIISRTFDLLKWAVVETATTIAGLLFFLMMAILFFTTMIFPWLFMGYFIFSILAIFA